MSQASGDFWWPSPLAFEDITVEMADEEDGSSVISLIAPDGTEAAFWLNYHNETPERHSAFEREFIKALREQINRVSNGQSKIVTDEQSSDHPGDQEDGAGSLEEHQSGGYGE